MILYEEGRALSASCLAILESYEARLETVAPAQEEAEKE